MKRIFRRTLLCTLLILALGFILPQQFNMPVKGADAKSYNRQSFWYYPWGKSITHKGVDIFARKGTPVLSATSGLVVFSGSNGRGGNSVIVLGPKWRLHYYAHLNDFSTAAFSMVRSGEKIGGVGNSGNAEGRPSHLHYSIVTPIPYPWNMDFGKQGFRRMFYVNPIKYLSKC